jgi:hypothetical protein
MLSESIGRPSSDLSRLLASSRTRSAILGLVDPLTLGDTKAMSPRLKDSIHDPESQTAAVRDIHVRMFLNRHNFIILGMNNI